MKNKVDREALKRSKKQHKKALEGAIVLKENLCPITEQKCADDCEEGFCNKAEL